MYRVGCFPLWNARRGNKDKKMLFFLSSEESKRFFDGLSLVYDTRKASNKEADLIDVVVFIYLCFDFSSSFLCLLFFFFFLFH
ncbi:hypothetical protein CSUI_006836 [Cystoisospora suis]|uniref:Uncharacterized protein n=1 Tax=Cystoisospora suis TaxID=483139 RepID=A0A2C6KSI2_9APIC|nr:hypothetical protein CSUI_006836 [Cystoisospora suis]